MNPNLISKAGSWLKVLNTFVHHRSCVFYHRLPPIPPHRRSRPPSVNTAHTLCTRGHGDRHTATWNSRQKNSNNRQTGGQKVMKDRPDRLWDGKTEGKACVSSEHRQHYLTRSVFAAGTAKRTAEMLKRKQDLTSLDGKEDGPPKTRAGKLQPPDRPLSPADWRKMKEESANPKRFDLQMMSLLFASGAELDIAKSLLAFVAVETGDLSYELLLRYLTLCVRGCHDAEVSDLYGIMRGRFSSLDTGAYSLFIKAFSRTERWREALNILQEVKKVFQPSPRNYGDVIAAAVVHGDTSIAWALYDEVMEKGLKPHQEMWEALFRGGFGEEGGKETYQKRLFSILFHMRDNQLYPQGALAGTIKSWFESLPGQNWTGSWTSVTQKGVCGHCKAGLESIHLTAEEYLELKDRVMSDIIQGQDVFNKTTPEELERFQLFVRQKPLFDVVVDGLNVANITRDQQSDALLAVVSELAARRLVVLVLGRKHMLRPSRTWDRHNMDLIQKKAHCFFTDNISEDDPFLLYATLHSGNKCLFVSRDLMRDHKACLPDGPARRLFFKWQRGHQMALEGSVAAGRRVHFQKIHSYDTIIQTTGDSWHIPYDDNMTDRSSYEVPQRWLCLTRTP